MADKVDKKEERKASLPPVETYANSELIRHSNFFGASRALMRTALKLGGKDSYSKEEVAALIKKLS